MRPRQADDALESRLHSYEQLVCQHTPALLRQAFRLTRSMTEADDLVQETLLRAWQYWDSFDPETNCRAWLYRILINVFRKQSGRLSEKSLHISTDQPEVLNVIHFEHQFDRDEQGIRAAFEQLPVEFQEVIELILVEGFSYKEAATMLEIPMGTVMSRLHRARQKMQSLLKPLVTQRPQSGKRQPTQ